MKRLFKCCKKRRNNLINDNGEELVDLIDESKDNDNKMYNYEKKMIENLIVKYYTAVSFALGKSKYDDEEGTNKEELLNIIGMFVNTLPLKCHIDSSKTFEYLLTRNKY